MRQVNNHPLAEFVYRTFGTRFGELILAGYNEEPSRKRKRFYITEEANGGSIEWVIEVVSNAPPSGQEPLILAALLKLLLQRPLLSSRLDFGIGELIEEVGWKDSSLTQRKIDRIISRYAALIYYKESRAKRGEGRRPSLGWGQYSLISAYLRESSRPAEKSLPTKISRSMEIDGRFVEGIRMGQVCFADINFGPLSN
jgi:hypothetical protein